MQFFKVKSVEETFALIEEKIGKITETETRPLDEARETRELKESLSRRRER